MHPRPIRSSNSKAACQRSQVDGECTETLVNGATREHRDFPFGLLLSDRNRDASKMSQELMQKYVQKQELTTVCRDIDLSKKK